MSKLKLREKEELFVYYYDGKPLTMAQSKWNEWRPPKKIYYTLGTAIANPPYHKELDKTKLSIVKYVPEEIVYKFE